MSSSGLGRDVHYWLLETATVVHVVCGSQSFLAVERRPGRLRAMRPIDIN